MLAERVVVAMVGHDELLTFTVPHAQRVTAASKLSESRRESELFVGNNAIDATQTRLGPSVLVLVHADERILIYSRGAPPARAGHSSLNPG